MYIYIYIYMSIDLNQKPLKESRTGSQNGATTDSLPKTQLYLNHTYIEGSLKYIHTSLSLYIYIYREREIYTYTYIYIYI